MSAQLFNPKAGKLVNVDGKQIKTLKKAGWLSPNDKKVPIILDKLAAEKEAAEKAAAEAAAKALKDGGGS